MRGTMPNRKAAPLPEDAAVSWARRRETIRGALKLFRVALDAVRRHAEWLESCYGVTAAQLWALSELGQSPGMRAVDLSRNMAVHRHTAEAILLELERRGLVRCTAEDQTAAHFLTDAGQRLVDAVPEHGQGVLKTALERLPDSSLEQVVDAMRALNECLPFREDRAALIPLADIVLPHGHEASPATRLEKRHG